MHDIKYKYDFEPISENLTIFEKKLSNLEQVRYIEFPEQFYKEAAYYKKIEGKTTYYYLFSKIKSRNYTKGSGYLTHGFDFYKGNFHGQMVRGLINYCNLKKGSIILDPFCGSGTTLIESNLLGYDSIGIDINPIACLNTKVKTELLKTPVNLLLLNNEKYLDLDYYESKFPIKINYQDFLNSDIQELFYIFLFTRAISDKSYISKNINQAFKDNFLKVINVLKAFEQLKKSKDLELGKSNVFFNDSVKKLEQIESNFIDAIITSPPYIDLIDYIRMDLHQIIKIFSLDQIKFLRKKQIGRDLKHQIQTERIYWQEVNIILKELNRILKKNHNLIIVLGSYRNMNEKFVKIAKKNRFSIDRILQRKVLSFKNRTNLEYVLFLRKSG